jgi:hypothetical protein
MYNFIYFPNIYYVLEILHCESSQPTLYIYIIQSKLDLNNTVGLILCFYVINKEQKRNPTQFLKLISNKISLIFTIEKTFSFPLIIHLSILSCLLAGQLSIYFLFLFLIKIIISYVVKVHLIRLLNHVHVF